MIGHETLQKKLLDLFKKNRLPGGILLAGSQGIGKFTLAKEVATYVLVGDPEGVFPVPGSHPVARRIASGGHGDLLIAQKGLTSEGRPARDISVDQIRSIISFMRKTPLEGGWRIVIVDSVDEMNRNASNALLKVLEEPPERALLLLVCHSLGKILPTIRSRCQTLMVRPLSDAQMELFLKERGVPNDLFPSLCALSEGCPGIAFRLWKEDGIPLYQELLSAMTKSEVLGISAYVSLVERYGDPLGKNDAADSFMTLGSLAGQFLARLVAGETLPSPSLSLLEGEREAFAALLKRHPLAYWAKIWQKILTDLNEAHWFSLNRKQVLMSLFQKFI